MARFVYQLPYGAKLLNDTQVEFSIWAPDLDELHLEINGDDVEVMERRADGVHNCTTTASAEDSYQFCLPDGLRVPDPASRQQQQDVHGPSIIVDPQRYEWQHPDWPGRPWSEMVIYEVHVGAYGGFTALIDELPRLLDMGITAIELMPIADFSGQRNWGYDGVLPYAPDTAYGTPDELKALIDAAHGLGLCVYLDVVYNHFGPDGNYLHTYASTFFSEDEPSPWGPAIDYRQRHVRDFFAHNALYWLMEYRFDGLRLDAVHAISDPTWLDETARQIRETCEPGRHVHLMLENEHNTSSHLEQDFDAQWNDDIHNVIHVLLTGEHEGYYGNYVDQPTEKLARALAEGFVYQGEPAPARDNRPRGTPSAHLAPNKFVFFLQNHDQVGNRALGERLTSLADPRALRAAVALQLLCPQTPLLFMGEERGLKTPFLFFTDFHGELAEAVRNGRRAEFSAFSHFADPQTQASIPDPNLEDTFKRSARDVACKGRTLTVTEQSWQAYYRELLQLRHTQLIPLFSNVTSLGASVIAEACVDARWQLADARVLRIVANFGDTEHAIQPAEGKTVFETQKGAADSARLGRIPGSATSVFLE